MYKTHYELETRWNERGHRQLAWGFVLEAPTLEKAIKQRDRLIIEHTDGPITSGYEVRIVRVSSKIDRVPLTL